MLVRDGVWGLRPHISDTTRLTLAWYICAITRRRDALAYPLHDEGVPASGSAQFGPVGPGDGGRECGRDERGNRLGTSEAGWNGRSAVSIWSGFAIAGEVATAGSGVANAAWFAHRAAHTAGPRRLASLLLMLLFAAVALDAAAHVLPGAPSWPSLQGVLLRLPLLAANVAAALAILAGSGRGRAQ